MKLGQVLIFAFLDPFGSIFIEFLRESSDAADGVLHGDAADGVLNVCLGFMLFIYTGSLSRARVLVSQSALCSLI